MICAAPGMLHVVDRLRTASPGLSDASHVLQLLSDCCTRASNWRACGTSPRAPVRQVSMRIEGMEVFRSDELRGVHLDA